MFRCHTAHDTSGNPVVRSHQAPSQCDHLANALLAAIARGPGTSDGIVEHRLSVEFLIAGRASLFHGQCIKQRLDGGTYLTTTCRHHIVLEEGKVGTAYIGLDITKGVHAKEAGT